MRFTREADSYFAHLPLPGARLGELDVAVVDDELMGVTHVLRGQ